MQYEKLWGRLTMFFRSERLIISIALFFFCSIIRVGPPSSPEVPPPNRKNRSSFQAGSSSRVGSSSSRATGFSSSSFASQQKQIEEEGKDVSSLKEKDDDDVVELGDISVRVDKAYGLEENVVPWEGLDSLHSVGSNIAVNKEVEDTSVPSRNSTQEFNRVAAGALVRSHSFPKLNLPEYNVMNLRNELLEAIGHGQDLLGKNAELVADIKSLEHQLEQKTIDFREAEKNNQASNVKLQQKLNANQIRLITLEETLENQATDCSKEKELLEHKLEVLERDNLQLKNKLNEGALNDNLGKNYDELMSRFDNVLAEKDVLQARNKVLEGEVAGDLEAYLENNELTKRNSELTERNEELKTLNKKIKNELEEQRTANNSMSEEIKRLRELWEIEEGRLQLEFNAKVRQLEETLDSVRSELADKALECNVNMEPTMEDELLLVRLTELKTLAYEINNQAKELSENLEEDLSLSQDVLDKIHGLMHDK